MAYWNGWGAVKDQALALNWFRRAAAGTDDDANGELSEGEVAIFAAAHGK